MADVGGSMMLPDRVSIKEVGPRDGLQAERMFLPTESKVALINALAGTGLAQIEAMSFVHPRAIPQLADAEQVMAAIDRKPGVVYSVLVPNAQGARRAVASKADEIVVFLSASETHNRRNVKMTVEDSLRGFEDMLRIGQQAGIPVSAIISTSFGCPFEGDIPEERIIRLAGRLLGLGIRDISLADTTGMANPRQVYRLCSTLHGSLPEARISLHFHNTRGAAAANILSGLLAGVTRLEASIGGLGGCPFAPGATGNVPTEDVVHMLEGMGINTGVDVGRLIECAKLAQDLLGRELPGQVMKAGACAHSRGTDIREAGDSTGVSS